MVITQVGLQRIILQLRTNWVVQVHQSLVMKGFNGGNKYGDTVKFNSSLLGKDEIYQSQLDSFGDSGQVPLTLGYNQNKSTINQIWEKGNSHYSNALVQQFGRHTNQTDTDELKRKPGGLGSRDDEIDEQYKFRTTKGKINFIVIR